MSKLNTFQKADRRIMKRQAKEQGVTVEFFPAYGVTLAYRNEGKTYRVSWAICSDDEEKARKKTGQYHAMNRWFAGESLPWPADSFEPHTLANMLALNFFDAEGRNQ